MGFFDYERIAEGYAKSRPQYHVLVMDLLRKKLNMEEGSMLEEGLDLGCGAGLSTTALLRVCRHAIGADASLAMVEQARKEAGEHAEFIQCTAEQLDFPENRFDVITIAGAINWIDEQVFLPIARKILKDGGTLVIYDNFMSDRMENCPEYTTWWQEEYLHQFPKPPRKENVWSSRDVEPYGFHIAAQEKYTNQFTMTKNQYIAYMLTQSNVVARVEEGQADLKTVRQWFEDSLEKVFRGKEQVLNFDGYVWFLY